MQMKTILLVPPHLIASTPEVCYDVRLKTQGINHEQQIPRKNPWLSDE